MSDLLGPVRAFLGAPTPEAWFAAALADQTVLLLDHANCEKKAASTALSMVFRYERHGELVARMSKLAREELRHFEQVQAIMAGAASPGGRFPRLGMRADYVTLCDPKSRTDWWIC